MVPAPASSTHPNWQHTVLSLRQATDGFSGITIRVAPRQSVHLVHPSMVNSKSTPTADHLLIKDQLGDLKITGMCPIRLELKC